MARYCALDWAADQLAVSVGILFKKQKQWQKLERNVRDVRNGKLS
jgi:hypothetical protein